MSITMTSGRCSAASATASAPSAARADDLDARVRFEQRREPVAEDRVVVGDQHPDRGPCRHRRPSALPFRCTCTVARHPLPHRQPRPHRRPTLGRAHHLVPSAELLDPLAHRPQPDPGHDVLRDAAPVVAHLAPPGPLGPAAA